LVTSLASLSLSLSLSLSASLCLSLSLFLLSSLFLGHLAPSQTPSHSFPHQSRLATNSVTLGDLSRPLRIQAFLADLQAGFRLLNLKNDGLRKKFDGMKYDVKRVEGVVYDLSIRGLIPKPA
jgi:hypothetical protein